MEPQPSVYVPQPRTSGWVGWGGVLEEYPLAGHEASSALKVGVAGSAACGELAHLHAGKVWNGAVRLAQLLGQGGPLQHRFQGAVVCELGAGAGLPSLVLLAQGYADGVVLSDYPDGALLEALQANVERNAMERPPELGKAPAWRVIGHDWGDMVSITSLRTACADLSASFSVDACNAEGCYPATGTVRGKPHVGNGVDAVVGDSNQEASSCHTQLEEAPCNPRDVISLDGAKCGAQTVGGTSLPQRCFDAVILSEVLWEIERHEGLVQTLAAIVARPAGEVWLAHSHHWPGHEVNDVNFFTLCAAKGLVAERRTDLEADMTCLFGSDCERVFIHRLVWKEAAESPLVRPEPISGGDGFSRSAGDQQPGLPL